MTMTTATATEPYPLTADQIDDFREQGFLPTRGVFNAEEVARLRALFVAESERQRGTALGGGYARAVFDQQVNLWLANRDLLGLALHPNMRSIATRLAGVPLRLWHDHLLVKKANNGVATEFHQDQPYWPHADSEESLSAWVALVDVPVERGCMSYIPGSHRHRGLKAQNLIDSRSLFEKCPELEWAPHVTVPVKAGDVVWHHSCTAHRACANATDTDRVVVSVIYMPRSTRYTGKKHCCTDGKDFAVGQVIAGDEFPEV
jgi:ectoine hydroxylase-related dioxygenase (phytanoyl-CoA dioxygenase family)